MKFDINNYKGKYVMHCKTEKEAIDFCKYLHSIRKRWNNVTSYLNNTEWDLYGTDTVYLFNSDLVSYTHYAKRQNYTILEWEDFMNKEFTKADLKTGDVVKLRCGELGIVITDFEVIACQNGGWLDFKHIREDLTDSFYGEKYDIMVVRRPKRNYECSFDAIHHDRGIIVYERKAVEEMTLAEVCKLLGKEIKIIQ